MQISSKTTDKVLTLHAIVVCVTMYRNIGDRSVTLEESFTKFT